MSILLRFLLFLLVNQSAAREVFCKVRACKNLFHDMVYEWHLLSPDPSIQVQTCQRVLHTNGFAILYQRAVIKRISQPVCQHIEEMIIQIKACDCARQSCEEC